MGLDLGHGRHDIGLMIRLPEFGRPVGFKVRPAALVLELSVQSFPALGFFLAVEQRIDGSLIYRNIGAVGDLEKTQHMLRFLLYPLIAADRGDAEDIKFLRLKEDENRLLVAGSRTARVLIDNDLDLLRISREVKQKDTTKHDDESARGTLHAFPLPKQNLRAERALPVCPKATLAFHPNSRT